MDLLDDDVIKKKMTSKEMGFILFYEQFLMNFFRGSLEEIMQFMRKTEMHDVL